VRLLVVDARRFRRNRAGLADAIAASRPDVTFVHGSPHVLRWRSISAALARRAGLVVVTGGRTAGANLVLSSLAVDVSTVRDVRFAEGGVAPAGVALAALKFRGSEFVVVCASLAGTPAQRLAQAGSLQAEIDHLVPGDLPVIISVDGVDRPSSAVWQALAERRVGVGDHQFVDGRITVEQATEPRDTQQGWLVHLSL
jgi:endonuclease/exonuclease/phosphatase family metal-dependent hydrolase